MLQRRPRLICKVVVAARRKGSNVRYHGSPAALSGNDPDSMAPRGLGSATGFIDTPRMAHP